MAQAAILGFDENTAWTLLRVTGVAILLFALWRLVDKYRLSATGPEGPSQELTVSLYGLVYWSFVSSTSTDFQ